MYTVGMSTHEWRIANHEKMKAYRRNYYNRNAESEKTRTKDRVRQLRTWFKEYKQGLSCSVCGESNPWCLDFHHRDPKTKDANPSAMIDQKGWGIERIMEELEKCDVLCSNCHRKKHKKEAEYMGV